MTMTKARSFLALACTLAPLAAQEKAGTSTPQPPTLLVPADSTLFLHFKAPAAIAALHAKDPAGAMFRAPVVREGWEDVSEELEPYLESWAGMLPEAAPMTAADVLALPKTFPDLDGSLTIGAYLLPTADLANPSWKDLAAVLQIDPGTGDIDPLCKTLQAWFDDRIEQPTEVKVKGITTAVGPLTLIPGMQITRPFTIGNQLCVCVGADAEAVLAEALATRPNNVALARQLTRDSTYGHFDNTHTTRALRTLMAKSSPEQQKITVLENALGLTGIAGAHFRSRSEQGRCVEEYEFRWREPPRGLFRALLPKPGARSALQGYVPYHLQDADLSHVAVQTLVDSAFRLLGRIQEIEGGGLSLPTMEQAEEAFRERIGLSLQADILNHLGEDYMKIEHVRIPDENEEELEADDPRLQRFQVQQEDTCHVLSLRNGEAFAKSLERTIRKLALHTARKRNLYKEQKVYTIRHPLLGGLEVHYAIHPNAAMVAFGKGGLHCLHAVVDEIRDREAGKPPTLPPNIAAQVDPQAPAPYSIGHVNHRETATFLAAVAEIQEGFGLEGWGTMLPAPIPDEQLNRLVTKIIRASIRVPALGTPKTPTHAIKTMHYRNQTWTMRTVW